MNRTLRKFLVILLVLIVVLVVSLFSIGRQPFNKFVEQQIIAAANSQGIRLSLKDTDLGLRNLTARSGELFVPHAFFLLPFQDLTVSPHWLSALSGEPGLSIETRLAQGSGRCRLVRGSGNQLLVDADLKEIEITDFSQIAALGLKDGTLNLVAENVTILQGQPTAGELKINLQKINKPLATQIQIMLGTLPIPIEIPAIRKGAISAELVFTPGKTIIKKLESLSSWGTISGSGELTIDANQLLTHIRVKGDVHLSEEGHASFRSFIPLISQGVLKLETTSFTFELSGRPPALKTRFFDLG